MLINRRDLESILKVMDKFDLKDEWSGVNIQYKDTPGGYDLSISFGHIINDIVCNISVVVDAETA